MTQPEASIGTQRESHEGTGTEEKEVSKAERSNPLILPYQPHASAHPRTAAPAAPQSCRRHVGRARVTFPCRASIASAAATVSRSTSLGKSGLNGVGVCGGGIEERAASDWSSVTGWGLKRDLLRGGPNLKT